ncbi:MAG: TRAP transporter large permease [Kiritimatiellae bacterium]|nr:TRAP transporter large permease [Kiritimatiellia bacterium]
MSGIIFVLVVSFFTLLVMNAPVAVAISVSSLLAIFAHGGDAGTIVAQRMANGINSFPLLAIPFFVFSGYLMGRGGLARRLIDFAALFVGKLPGGLSYVNTVTCMLFGSISGSAAAAVSSIGGFMIPEMNKKGYDRDFNVALTATAATTGLLIPPSNCMIVYSVAAGSVSIAAMFMAGILPGIVVGLCIMAAAAILCVRHGYGKRPETAEEAAIRQMGFWRVTWRAVPSLLLIVIIIGGILAGVFSATEAAAIAVLYAFLLSCVFYREIPLRDLPGICLQTGLTTAVVMLLIGASSAMSWIMTVANIPQSVSSALLGMSENPYVILLAINVMLLLVGTFMDMTPAILIFTPILLPIVTKLGLDPIQFGIILIANLCIGLCTPPVGTCLFIGCGVGKSTIAKVTVKAVPFFLAMVISLLLITFIPWLSLAIPRLCGLIEN